MIADSPIPGRRDTIALLILLADCPPIPVPSPTDYAIWKTPPASGGSAATILNADNGGDGVASDGLGQAYLWIGGSVTPAAQQQRGSYSGTFTVGAAYSN